MNTFTVCFVAAVLSQVAAIGPIGFGNLGKVPKCEPSPTTTSGTYGTHTGIQVDKLPSMTTFPLEISLQAHIVRGTLFSKTLSIN